MSSLETAIENLPDKTQTNIRNWLKMLREEDRKLEGELGYGNVDDFKACCLGVGTVVLHGEKAFNEGGFITSGSSQGLLCSEDIENLSLNCDIGGLTETVTLGEVRVDSLADVNDKTNLTHPQIADFIEEHAAKIFRQS